MANTFLNFTIPATNGAGAPLDTSAMGKEKTLIVGGDFKGSSIGIQVSTDGTNYHTIATFFAATKKVITVAAQFMRIFVQGRSAAAFTAFCTVGANDVGGDFVDLIIPAGDGVGVAVDISALGNFTTVTVGGDFVKSTLILEVSEDGVNYAQCATFNAPGAVKNLEFVANWARFRVSGRAGNTLAFTPQASIGAARDGTSNLTVKSQRWIVGVADVLDIVIPIPGTPMPSDNYVVTAQISSTGLALPGITAPDILLADRTTTEFRLQLSSALDVGDVVEFVIVERDSASDFTGPPPPEFIDVTDATVAARTHHTITKLNDGRMLIASGDTTSFSGVYTSTCFIYDPADDSFTATGAMTNARGHHSSVLLADGRVLTVGGNINGGGVTDSCEIFDPIAGTWSAAANLPSARQDSISLWLITAGPNVGNVLSACGNFGAGAINDSNIYNVGGNTWGNNATATSFHRSHNDVQLADGRIILFGGLSNEGGGGNGTQIKVTIWDPATNTWSAGLDLPSPRRSQGVALLPSGSVLLAGGIDSTGGPATALATTVVYDPDLNTYSAGPNISSARTGGVVVALDDGTVLVAGGGGDFPILTNVSEYYTEGTNSFTPAPNRLHTNFHASTTQAQSLFAKMDSPNGVFIFGGETFSPFVAVNDAERFNP